MNATLNSPSHSIENSLLTYNPSSPAFAHSTSHAAQDSPPSAPPHIEAGEAGNAHLEHERGSAGALESSEDASEAVSTPLPPAESEEIQGQNHDRIGAPMEPQGRDEAHASVETTSAPTEETTTTEAAAAATTDTSTDTATNSTTTTTNTTTATAVPGSTATRSTTREIIIGAPHPLERTTTASTMDVVQDDGDDESDDDPYEDNRAFLTNLNEDTSTPDDAEIAEIESREEILGTNEDHWEQEVWEPLNDPEYIVGASGRISWTISPFHGTVDAPNRQRIMRSPKVEIGGYLWNIKLFPRGNEGTNQLSVYVECSGPVVTNDGGDTPMRDVAIDDTESASASAALDSDERAASIETLSSDDEDDETPWQVAAQIGCVMYNPQEPRTTVFDTDHHCFENATQDWGWVRFHGPWHEIHRRMPHQRKPLLQNDTLTMTVFVRIIHDPTRALWWDGSCVQESWNSLAKSGHRGLRCYEPAGHAMVAAMAMWIHLKPFRDLVLQAPLPNSAREPRRRTRPLLQALSNVLYGLHSPSPSSESESLRSAIMALDYYNHSLDSDSDVVETWENLEHLINKELTDFALESDSDVLKQFDILRQQVKPTLPQSNTPAIELEAHSVQQLLDVRNPSSKRRHAPDVLHVELPRQRYDSVARKWRRLTHQITLEETVTWDGASYTLYGMIVHQGELGSGLFHAVLRPYGPTSYWVRYGGIRGKDVIRLTRKQAINAHQGRSGASESAAVAYLAIYIKTSSLAEILFSEPPSSEPVHHPMTRPLTEPLPLDGSVPVVVFDASKVKHSGAGFVDLWTKDTSGLLEFDLPYSFPVGDLAKYLVERFSVATDPAQCRIWPLRIVVGNVSRHAPILDPLLPESMTMGSLATQKDGGRFWLHVVPIDSLPPPPAPVEPTAAVEGPDAIVEASAAIAPPPLPVDAPPVYLEVPHISIDVAHVSSPTIPPVNEPTSEDVVMGGTQEAIPLTPIDVIPARPPPPVASTEALIVPPKHIYYFVKMFDVRRQELRMLGSWMARQQDCIKDHLRRLKLLPPDKRCAVHLEGKDGTLDRSLKPHRTFAAEKCPEVGCILVLEERLHAIEVKKFHDAGKAANAAEYYLSMELLEYFGYQGSHYVDSYFGGPYHDTPLQHGVAFGECVMIDVTGDAYVGNCVARVKSGAGTMFFANGDTYTGAWEADAPHGQGTMVYGATQNRYVGGWKAGRRHGRGTMYFEVADEEAQLCKICFEREMDALFYRCGHVAACEPCAKQVQTCPVCRKAVEHVVRIWKT